MTDGTCTLADVNAMKYEDFIARFGGAVEHGALVAASVSICRPFRSVDHMCCTFSDFLDRLPHDGSSGFVLYCIADVSFALFVLTFSRSF